MTTAKHIRIERKNDWRSAQRAAAKGLRKLLVDADLKAVDLLESLDVSASQMSDYLNVRRGWPDDFEARFRAAVAEKRAK